MIETLVAEITELEIQKEKYSTLLGQTEIGTAKHDAIKIELDKTVSKLEVKEAELIEQRDQTERRAQQQEESLDALATFVTELGLYRLAKPVPEDGERLTEYTETEKEFNEIVYFGYRDYTKGLQDEFNKRDDVNVAKITALKLANEELNLFANESLQKFKELEEKHKILKEANFKNVKDLLDVQGELEEERMKNDELTEKLEQKPVAAPQLSGTLQDKIASFKQNNTIKSNLELVLSGELPARGKVVLGGSERLDAPPLEFNISDIVEGNQLPAAETPETVEQFPTPSDIGTAKEVENAGFELADEAPPMVGSPVSREEFNELSKEVADLKVKFAEIVGDVA